MPVARRQNCTVIGKFTLHCLTEQALSLCDKPTIGLDVTGRGRAAALRELEVAIPADAESRRVWMQNDRINAILGSCPRTRASFKI